MDINYFQYESKFGIITIISNGKAITGIKIIGKTDIPFKKEASKLTDKAAEELSEYFAGKRREFDIPLSPDGTEFQRSVWETLMSINYGETRSYKQVAEMVGKPNACRAVGMANNKNPIWIMIPCHRVIGADGSLTGYGGGLELKQQLLKLEKIREIKA